MNEGEIISGHLTRNPELSTAYGRVICDFNVRVRGHRKRRSRKERPYVGCRLWGDQAELFAKVAGKGDEVRAEGQWWSLDGTGRRGVRINVRTMEVPRLNVSTIESIRLRSGRSQDAWSFQGEPGS